jgi:formylglycine-generating enzyme required for sulfatase activity
VADWYDSDYYADSPSQNPSGPASGFQRVLRGGSWQYGSETARSSYRFNVDLSVSNFALSRIDSSVGFRCVVPGP